MNLLFWIIAATLPPDITHTIRVVETPTQNRDVISRPIPSDELPVRPYALPNTKYHIIIMPQKQPSKLDLYSK